MNTLTFQPAFAPQKLSVAEIDEVGGAGSPLKGFAIRGGIGLVALGAGGVIVGGLAAYAIYACSE